MRFRKIISFVLILTMLLTTSMSFAQSNTATVSSDISVMKQTFENMPANQKSLFLNEISKDPTLLNFHKQYIGSTSVPKTMLVKTSASTARAAAVSANALAEIRTGLQALSLPTAVYYSLVEFAASLCAAVADGPLPVGDIVALGSAVVTGVVVGWYWNDIKAKIPAIKKVFTKALSKSASSISAALDKLFSKAETDTQATYEKAKKDGKPTKSHSTENGSSLPTTGKPNSSKDLKDAQGVKQRRYYDKNGKADLDIDYRHGGNGTQKFPHRHKWTNGQRGPEY